MTTNLTWVKRVKIQVRSVLFTATSRTRVRSGDHFSVCIEFLPYELKKKKKKPKKCSFTRAGTGVGLSARTPR